MSDAATQTILVAGDVCLDVLGVPIPPTSKKLEKIDNWRLTGETRTHFLLGGTMLVAELIKQAIPTADVRETRIKCPEMPLTKDAKHRTPNNRPLNSSQLQGVADRLTRDEIVHSLLSLNYFGERPDSKAKDVIRIQTKYGYSGPQEGEPSLESIPPDSKSVVPNFVVLDDTGNLFRRDAKLWPSAIGQPEGAGKTLIVHKLHRPLPRRPNQDTAGEPKSLWKELSDHYPKHRLVIVSVDDLRAEDAMINRGLSWERTALDLVWELLNRPTFSELRTCPHLIIRLGLDGAVYWQHTVQNGNSHDRAWLIYDPTGIEGTGASAVEGEMVGYGSTFTAAIVKHLAEHSAQHAVSNQLKFTALQPFEASALRKGIQLGLVATRRLLRLGFGRQTTPQPPPKYPMSELFEQPSKDEDAFACQPIPIIPQAAIPDRGYWRLLDTIFREKTAHLHAAVALTATGAKPVSREDEEAMKLLKQVPIAVFAGALSTFDRRDTENYRALYTLMLEYLQHPSPPRPLSVAVFGPPGAGKSFGIKMVAKALSQLGGSRAIETLTFNLSQYQMPDQLTGAFHLVRDLVLRGKIPLVFFDEFDTSMDGVPLGWLRYFLAPMQDAEFLDRGVPHPIGQAIFVFAGGTCSTYAKFAKPIADQGSAKPDEFQAAKGPDFLSRLRGTLDVSGLNLNDPFDSYGPVEAFPCEAAILLRRADILGYQLREKAPQLRDSEKTLRVSPVVLRALLHLPQFEHGNRSFEALLDMSHLPGKLTFTAAQLPSPSYAGLHADPNQFRQLLSTEYPFSAHDGEIIAEAIHENYRAQRLKQMVKEPNDPEVRKDSSLNEWSLLTEKTKESNRQQAEDIPRKLRTVGLWYRKTFPGMSANPSSAQLSTPQVEMLAHAEHDRFVAEKRRQGWSAAADTNRNSRNKDLLLHNLLVPWDQLSEADKELNREPIRMIPNVLAKAGYEIIKS